MKTKLLPLLLSALAGLLATNLAWGFAFILDDRGTGALPIKWPPGTVSIQLKLTPSGNNNFNGAVQASAAAWNAVIGNLQLNAQPASGTTASESNNSGNEVVFAADVFGEAFGSNTLAVTTTWSRGNERTQADIVFNSARTWAIYDGPTQSSTDLKRVALHELGHLLGLDHPDEAGQNFPNPQPIMNSRITSNDTLTADDINGAQSLYGPPGAPANNNFADAITLTLNGSNTATGTGYNTNATKQTGEPSHAGSAGTHSVWWKWTAPASGSATVDTRGSYFDTALGVYTGTAVNSLNTVGSNDDISSTPHIQASSVTFTASSGTTYYFAVDGWDGDCGGITLNLAFTPNQNLPVITTQPASLTVAAGGSANFSVTATNATTYQWFFNGNAVGPASSIPTFAVLSAQASNAGNYFVAVTNSAGTVNSNTVTLTVTTPTPPPSNPTPPSSGGGGGGGGGGAPSHWFYGTLSLLLLARFLRRR